MKKFLIGFIVGVLIAFHLGINFGRHKPLWSNPYADDVVEQVKESAGQAIESTRKSSTRRPCRHARTWRRS